MNRKKPPINSDLSSKKEQIITLTIFKELGKIDPSEKHVQINEQFQRTRPESQAIGLYLFSEPMNSILYTYGILLLVSLPKLSTGWSLRMLTGWYWLYCLLLVVAYKASMTAILSQPTPRVTIDTLQELQDSGLTCGVLGDLNKEFFMFSLDPSIKAISKNLEEINDTTSAVDRVAEGKFAFYENTYYLKEALVKRQIHHKDQLTSLQDVQNAQQNSTFSKKGTLDKEKNDRGLHIMSDCVIKMPVSIGLQKNSPIKPRVDKIIRKMLEAGLIQKWLDDVMLTVLSSEIQTKHGGAKAIMDMKKFFGAIVVLFIGYFLGIVALITEIVYYEKVVKKNANYNKYSKSIQFEKHG